jgi:hypothetical protein
MPADMVTCQQALLAPRAAPAIGRAARSSAVPRAACASTQQRSAALRRLAATPDEASASPRARSEERVVSLEELLSAVRGSGIAARRRHVG